MQEQVTNSQDRRELLEDIRAAETIKKWYSILGKEQHPARLRWMRGLIESDIQCVHRRRAWLTELGKSGTFAYDDWDKLPASVRDALKGNK